MSSQLTFSSMVRIALVASSIGVMSSVAGAQTWCGNPIPPCNPNDTKSSCYQPPPPDPRCEPRECDKCQKSPCFVATGVYSISESDLTIPTPGFPLEVSRSYSSANLVDGPLGHGWTSNLTARLHDTVYLLAAPDTFEADVVIIMPDGARYRFLDQGDGTFTPPPGRFDHLVANPDGSFDLTLQRTRSVMRFDVDGTLAAMADDFGNTLAYTYDTNGRLQRVADTAGSGRHLDVYWGADGRVSSVVDHTGRTIGYQYWPDGLLHTVTDPLGRIRTYDPAPGKYVSLLGEIRDNWDRVITTITYDAQDRVHSYTELGETWTYTYNYQNNPARTAKADSLGNTWVFVHGTGGLVTDAIPPAGTGGAPVLTTYDGNGAILEAVDEVGVRTTFTYDAMGRLSSTTYDAGGSQALHYEVSYDVSFPDLVKGVRPIDPVTGEREPEWSESKFEYHPLGSAVPGALWRTFRVLPDGVSQDLLWTLEYDTRGLIVAEIDATGATWTYQYNAAGDLVTAVAPPNSDGGVGLVYEFDVDAVGRPVEMRDPKAYVTRYSYDALDRLVEMTKESAVGGGGATTSWYYSYDEFVAEHQVDYSTVTDPNGSVVRRGNDQFGRAVRVVGRDGSVLLYDFDRGLLTSMTDANSNVTAYQYDNARRLAAVVFWDGSTESARYRGDGKLEEITDRLGRVNRFTYDRLGRFTSKMVGTTEVRNYLFQGEQVSSIQVNNGFQSAFDVEFDYDDRGRVIRETQGTIGELTYSYDELDRVVYVGTLSGPSITYGYYPDSSVRRVTWSETDGDFIYSYDTRGQLTALLYPNGQQVQYIYDYLGRPISVSTTNALGGLVASYQLGYDEPDPVTSAARIGALTHTVTTVPSLGLSAWRVVNRFDQRGRLSEVQYPEGPPLDGEVDGWVYDGIGNRLASVTNGLETSYSYQLNVGGNASSRLAAAGLDMVGYRADGAVTSLGSGSSVTTFDYNLDDEPVTVTTDGVSLGVARDRLGLPANGYLKLGLEPIWNPDTQVARLPDPLGAGSLAIVEQGAPRFSVPDGLRNTVGMTDIDGAVVRSVYFDPWGVAKFGEEDPMVGFAGQRGAIDGLRLLGYRFYSPTLGRFLSEDPMRDSNWALPESGVYGYVENNPLQYWDPLGLKERCKYEFSVEPYVAGRDPTTYSLWRRVGGGIATGSGFRSMDGSPAGPGKSWVPKKHRSGGRVVGPIQAPRRPSYDGPVVALQVCDWQRWRTERTHYRVRAHTVKSCFDDCTGESWYDIDVEDRPASSLIRVTPETMKTYGWMFIWIQECSDPNKTE